MARIGPDGRRQGRRPSNNDGSDDDTSSSDDGSSSESASSSESSTGGLSPGQREQLREERRRATDESESSGDGGGTSGGDDDSGSSDSSGRSQDSPGGSDLRQGDPDTGLTEQELRRMDARVVGDTATDPTEDQLQNLRNVAQSRAGRNDEIYISRTPSGAAVAFAGGEAGEAASTSTRRTAARQFEQQAEQETGQDLTPGQDFTVQETDSGFQATYTESFRRRRAEEELERQLEEQTGEDLTPGEDFTVEETEDGYRAVFSDSDQQEQETEEYTFTPDARARSQMGGDQDVRVAPVSEEEATADLEQQLEERFGRDLEPGEDFSVQETDQGFRAEPTDQFERELFREQLMEREDVDSPDDFEISEEDGELQATIEPDRREEDFVEGMFSAVDDVISPAVTSFEAQSGVDVPGEGPAVTTSDTGSPDQISGGARDVAGVENTTSVSEVSDDVFGQADDDVRQGRQNVSQAATDPDSPYNVVDNVVEFLDADNEPLPYMEEELTDEGLERVQGVQGSAPSGAAAVGPGGVARGGARVAASGDDILKALGITGAAAGLGVASQEVDVPEQRDRSELEVAESAPGAEVSVPEDTSQPEIAVPEEQGTQTEVDVGEAVTSSEVTIPEENTDVNVFSASPVVQGEVGQQQEQEEEDGELGVPDNVWDRSDRRLYDPQREFGEQEDISQSVDPTRDENPSEQDIGSGIAGTGSGFEPARGRTVEENFQEWMEEQRQLEEEAQRQQVLQRDEVVGRGEFAGESGETRSQQSSQDLLEEAQEQQVTGQESTSQRADEWLTPFEDSSQQEDVFSDQAFDDALAQGPAVDETVTDSATAEPTLDDILDEVGQTETVGAEFGTPTEYGFPNRTTPEYNYPGQPGTGRPGSPSRIPLPDFDETETSDLESEGGILDKVFDTGVVQSLDELENGNGDDGDWF